MGKKKTTSILMLSRMKKIKKGFDLLFNPIQIKKLNYNLVPV